MDANDIAVERERERLLRRKREAEVEENPFAAIVGELREIDEEEAGEDEWVSAKRKKELRTERVDQLKKKVKGEEPEELPVDEDAAREVEIEEAKELTLLDEANALRAAEKNMGVAEIRKARAAAEEERMRKDADRVQTNALMSSAEVF
jgi:hypothetical protein